MGIQITLIGIWILQARFGDNAGLISLLLVVLGSILVVYPLWAVRMDRLP